MTQNQQIIRFRQTLANKTKATLCFCAAVSLTAAFPAITISQVVVGGAFEQPSDHSILEYENDGETATDVNGLFSNPNTGSSTRPSQASYDAPRSPVPRMIGARPVAPVTNSPGSIEPGGDSSGIFSGTNPVSSTIGDTPAAQPASKPRPSSARINDLRSAGLSPSPEGSEVAPFTSTQFSSSSNSSTGSFPSQSVSSSPSTTTIVAAPSPPASAQPTPPVVSSYSASFVESPEESPFGETENETSDQFESGKYESAYLHDQQPQQQDALRTAAIATPQVDNFSSPNTSQRLTPPAQLRTAPVANGSGTIAQTAFTSPIAPATPQQFQNNSGFQNGQNGQGGQNNQRFGQRGQRGQGGQNQSFGQQQPNRSAQYGQGGQGGQSFQRQGQPQPQGNRQPQNAQTRQRDLPPNQQKSTNGNTAKQVIAKFAFESNQESSQGLPIQLSDILQQSQGIASRTQLTQQYWEVYYDWAQSISARKHQQWIESINSAKQTDAGSLEIAKSNAKNAISFSTIQLGKSQAKMKSLTGNPQPIIPINSPTVTRVKTNYEAFKSRGLVPSKYDGIDEALKQMYELILARADTVSLAEKNANEAQQQYSRNQSTIDHVLIAGQTWRSAESDFLGSVIEYNKAYADYALALPYGQGPVETAIAMLIVKPSASNTNDAQAGTRINLSNASASNAQTPNSNTQGDSSVPYRNASSSSLQQNNPRNDRSARNNRAAGNRNTAQPASNLTRQPAVARQPNRSLNANANGIGNNSSQANNLMRNARQQPQNPSAAKPPAFSPASSRTSAGATGETAGQTNLISRPSPFPTNPTSGGSGFATKPAASNTGFSPRPAQNNNSLQPQNRAFQGQRPPTQQPPIGDRTANRGASPFSAFGKPANASALTPQPQPPTNP